MRRQGNFTDSPANAYGAGQIQNSHSDFQGQLEAFTPERDQPQADGPWRWERDGPTMSRPMTTALYTEGQGVDSTRTYYSRPVDSKLESDQRVQPQHQENTKSGYENNRGVQTFEGLEQKFMDDLTRLAKDQIEAEDTEIARHREKINTINIRYEEQLAALRARHSGKREDIMRKESQARQQQYKQQTMGVVDQYHPGSVVSGNPVPSGHPQGYIGNAQDPAAVADAPSRSYGSDRFEAYGERARFQGGTRDQGFESRVQYPAGNAYDTASRFY